MSKSAPLLLVAAIAALAALPSLGQEKPATKPPAPQLDLEIPDGWATHLVTLVNQRGAIRATSPTGDVEILARLIEAPSSEEAKHLRGPSPAAHLMIPLARELTPLLPKELRLKDVEASPNYVAVAGKSAEGAHIRVPTKDGYFSLQAAVVQGHGGALVIGVLCRGKRAQVPSGSTRLALKQAYDALWEAKLRASKGGD
jgi:hypothetical protein